MKHSFVLHDYENCLVNLANSVLKRFGLASSGKTLDSADKYLKKGYKNVVILLLDGLGTSIMEGNLNENGFLRSHYKNSFSSVFPPTTVAATTSLMSGLQPIESAWLGWDCYYPQVDKNVTVFLNTEQGTDNQVSTESVAWKYCGYDPIVNRLVREGKIAYNLTPFAAPFSKSVSLNPKSFPEMCDKIVELLKGDEEKYIYAYWDEPDTTMHKCGCYGSEAKNVLYNLETQIMKMSEELEDTLLIITADHGHIEGRNISITDYPAILDCLVRMPSIEPRALNLFVKEEKKAKFESEFNKEFGNDYILLNKQEIYESKLFGFGKPHKNVDAMIGDYLAVAVTDLTIFNTKEEAEKFKGVHAGYMKDELSIPLIVVEK